MLYQHHYTLNIHSMNMELAQYIFNISLHVIVYA